MRAPVFPLSQRRFEELATNQALVLAPGTVRLLVALQRLFEGEPASALRAEERLLPRVDSLMSSE